MIVDAILRSGLRFAVYDLRYSYGGEVSVALERE